MNQRTTQEQAPRGAPAELRGAAPARRGAVWLLEDSALEAEVARRMLASEHDVELFADGSALLERLAAGGDPDVLVLDWELPGMSGLEVLAFVRQTRDEVTLPVLILTARADEPDTLAAFRAGANDFVTKPYRAEVLRARVTTLVRVRALDRGMRAAERERAELLAREQAARAELEAIVEAMPDGVYVADARGDLMRVNSVGAAMLGYPSPAVMLRAVPLLAEEINTRDPESGEPIAPERQPIVRALRGERVVCEVLVRPLDGAHDRVVRCAAAPVRQGERITAAVAVNTDITEQRRAEEALRRDAAFRERFVGILGHDLRTPLHAVAFTASMLLRRDDVGEGHLRALARIATSAARMERMIADLLDFTRSREGGGMPVARVPMDLREACGRVLDEIEVARSDRVVALEAHGDTRGVWDASRVEQVVANLVTNALDYSPADTAVRVTVRGEPDAVTLEVNNQGVPIPPGALATLFDPFRRAGAGATAATTGTSGNGGSAPPRSTGLGLGLYIVDQIARAHGGAVQVFSDAHAGTTFTVRLPRGAP